MWPHYRGCGGQHSIRAFHSQGVSNPTFATASLLIYFYYRYIHSRHKIENHIDLTEATLSLAICCIRYLCQDHHSPDISEKDLEAGIKMGNYRLHYYAADTWLSLVTQYLRLNQSQVLSEELITTLHKFYEEQCKQDLSGRTELKEQRYPSELQQFKSRNPNIFCFLRGIAQFQQKCSTSLYHLEQGETSCSLVFRL